MVVIHRLHQILEPFMLRRQVQDVEGSLPQKVRPGIETSTCACGDACGLSMTCWVGASDIWVVREVLCPMGTGVDPEQRDLCCVGVGLG